MLKFLFTRKFSLFDVTYICAAASLLAHDRWVSGAVFFVAGLVASVAGEMLLAHREAGEVS